MISLITISRHSWMVPDLICKFLIPVLLVHYDNVGPACEQSECFIIKFYAAESFSYKNNLVF